MPADDEEIEVYQERFEAWWERCHDDKRFLWLETEFGRLLGILIRPGASTVIRQAWDSVTLETRTKRGTLQAANPHVSIIAHITAEELRRAGQLEHVAELGDVCLQRIDVRDEEEKHQHTESDQRHEEYAPEPGHITVDLVVGIPMRCHGIWQTVPQRDADNGHH